MRKANEEFVDPNGWLSRIVEGADYVRLVSESKGMARAAYRIARARRSVQAGREVSPDLIDLQSAAWLVAAHLNRSGELPIVSLLHGDSAAAKPAVAVPVERTMPSARPALGVAAQLPPPSTPPAIRRSRSRPDANRVSP